VGKGYIEELIEMARRRRRKSNGRSRGLTLDGTALKVGGILFRQFNGPATVRRLQSKDVGGAMDEWGKGNLTSVLGNSILAGAGMKIKNSFTGGVRIVKSRFFNFKF